MRVYDSHGRPKDRPVLYLTQTVAERYWDAREFTAGHNIIGVRHEGAAIVYLPNDLPAERLITIKDEAGLGQITVRIY